MASFRKKPVEIEAVRVTAVDANLALLPDWKAAFDGRPFSDLPDWLIQAIRAGTVVPICPGSTDYAEWRIKTLEGDMKASPGDYIIRGVKGELYPCKPDIFAATYEEVA